MAAVAATAATAAAVAGAEEAESKAAAADAAAAHDRRVAAANMPRRVGRTTSQSEHLTWRAAGLARGHLRVGRGVARRREPRPPRAPRARALHQHVRRLRPRARHAARDYQHHHQALHRACAELGVDNDGTAVAEPVEVPGAKADAEEAAAEAETEAVMEAGADAEAVEGAAVEWRR